MNRAFEIGIQNFLADLVGVRGLARNTVESYRFDLINAAEFFLAVGRRNWAELTRDDLLDYLDALRADGMECTTITRHLVSLKMLFRFLTAEEIVPVDITLVMDSPRLWTVLPEFLTVSEVGKLLNAYSIDGDAYEVRNRTILEILYSSGLRASELVSLTLSSIDFDEEFLRVTGKGNKTRLVPIGKPALRMLQFYLDTARNQLLGEEGERSALIFLSRNGRKLDRERIWQLVKQAALRAGITRSIHPHTLRHSFASHLLANGADLRMIQDMLGHANIATTEVYTHVDTSRLASIHRKFHPRG